MKKKKKCIICKGKKFRLVRTVNGVKIYECVRCFLGINDVRRSTKNKKIVREEKRRATKFKEIAVVLRDLVREGKVLETGYGYGLYAPLATEKKYKIPSNKPTIKHIYLNSQKYRIKIIKKTFEQFLVKNSERFDLITFIDNFSDFRRPDLILAKSRSSLLDQGLILILVPNYKSFMSGVSLNWPWWQPQHHAFHFSTSSIKLLLAQEKYKVKYFTTFDNWHDIRKSVEGNFSYIKNTNKRRLYKGIFFLIFTPLYFVFRRLIWATGYGGELCVIASKS